MKNFLLVTNSFYVFGQEISFYGLLISIGMLLGVIVAIYIVRKKGYSKDMPINLALYALPCAIVGARIYYCVFHGVDSFWQIFRIWEGGMAIYGGVIGGFLGVLLCSKIHKYSLLECCDLAAPCLILGQAIGRIGCYFAGCCYGVETTDPMLMFFPLSVQINGTWHLATFFYESFIDFIGFMLLFILTHKISTKGVITAGYFIIYGTARALLEAFRDPKECLMIGSLRVSLCLSVLLVVVGAVMLFVVLKKKGEPANE